MASLENKLKLQANGGRDDDPGNNGGNNNNGGGGNNNGNNNNGREDDVSAVDFLEDPMKHVRAEANKVGNLVAAQTINLGATIAYNNAKATLPLFDQFEAEIKETWDKQPINAKMNAKDLIENIYHIVRSKHLDEIVTDSTKRDGRYNIVASGGNSNSGNNTNVGNKKPEDNITDDQKRAARSFGMTDAEYMEQAGKMRFV